MVLATSEFCFILEFYPGVKNVLADFGTRHIDISEWEEADEDDPTGISGLFVYVNEAAMTELPD